LDREGEADGSCEWKELLGGVISYDRQYYRRFKYTSVYGAEWDVGGLYQDLVSKKKKKKKTRRGGQSLTLKGRRGGGDYNNLSWEPDDKIADHGGFGEGYGRIIDCEIAISGTTRNITSGRGPPQKMLAIPPTCRK